MDSTCEIKQNTMPSKKPNKASRYLLGAILPALIIGGWFFNPLLGYSIFFCMFGAIAISYFNGKYWCYWYCPRGIFWDEYLAKISLNRKIPPLFKKTAFRVMWVVILMSVMVLQYILSGGNVRAFGKGLLMMLTVTTTIGIVLGVYYNPRIWCFFCPASSFSWWIGRGKKPVKIDGSKCADCGTCTENCPMEVDASKYKDQGYIDDWDCIKCSKCSQSCPEQSISIE